jgi:site-specific recombinase XerD
MSSNPRLPQKPINAAVLARLHPLMRDHLGAMVLRGRDRTALTAAEVLDPFYRWVQEQGFDLLTMHREQLERYQDFLVTTYRTAAGKPLAKSTASMRITMVKGFFRWLVDQGHLVADPARHLGIRVIASRVVVAEHLSLQEATALLQTQAAQLATHRPGTPSYASDLRNLAALALTLATGRRIGGIVSLTVAQVDLERRELRVEREKGHVGRVLPVAGWAMDVVALYLREARPLLSRGHDTPWLFVNLRGTKPIERSALNEMLGRLLLVVHRQNPDLTDLPGKRISWHSLRVSYAKLLFENGCDIRSVNELMLHRDLSTTAKYTPVAVEDLRLALRAAHPRP